MAYSCGTVILAAGQSKRFKMAQSKPLAPLLGKRMIDFPIAQIEQFFQQAQLNGSITVVTGHMRELLENYLKGSYPSLSFAFQQEQKGTADALRVYFASNQQAHIKDYTLVMCADTPLIRSDDLLCLYERLNQENLDGVLASFLPTDPKGYGRIVSKGMGLRIVEEKDTDEVTKKIKEVNSGLYLFKTSFILQHLNNIDSKNSANEFYLTDLFQENFKVKAQLFEQGYKFSGVNDLKQLEEVERYLRRERNEMLMEQGVRLIDSVSTYVDWNVLIGTGTVIYPNVVIEGNCRIGENVRIETGSVIKSSTLADQVEIKAHCYLEEAVVGQDAVIGPFARLRSGSDIGQHVKVGNFVETKKAILHEGVKVSHLSYVGDAEIGNNTNIGCGFITCNYDGAQKHKTVIGKNSFIGSDSQMIAPVTIGDECFVASGSTITNDMPNGAFAISRARQQTKQGMAKRFLKSKK